jgi:hypothetical protein
MSLPPPLSEGHGARFMSILQERDSLAEAFFGVDRAELDFVFDHLNQRYFQPIARVAETLPLLFQVIARESNSIAQKIESSPQIPSYEKLLKERCGYGRLGARIMAHQIVTGAKSGVGDK